PRTGIKGQGCQADGRASLPSCWHRSRLQCGARDAGAQLGTFSDEPAKPIWFAATGTATNSRTLAAVRNVAAPATPTRRVVRTTWLAGKAAPDFRWAYIASIDWLK